MKKASIPGSISNNCLIRVAFTLADRLPLLPLLLIIGKDVVESRVFCRVNRM